jgi:predicted transcriptional regulator
MTAILRYLTSRVVSAYLAENKVAATDVPEIIHTVYGALATVGQEPQEADVAKPAVPIKKSVTAEHLVCLDCGRKLKMLRRHVTEHGLDLAGYKAKWGLPSDYPVTAPNYAAARSAMAKQIGLGRKPKAEAAPAVPAKAKRGRRAKAE